MISTQKQKPKLILVDIIALIKELVTESLDMAEEILLKMA